VKKKEEGAYGVLVALLPQDFTYLKCPAELPEISIVAYATVKTPTGLRLALQVKSTSTCVCNGNSYYDMNETMSELVSAGFRHVPIGISSDLPLHELPSNTIVFLRSHNDNGLGNYLPYGDGGHRPIPIARYGQVKIPTSESLTVIVEHDIPAGIFELDDEEVAVAS